MRHQRDLVVVAAQPVPVFVVQGQQFRLGADFIAQQAGRAACVARGGASARRLQNRA